MKITLFSPNVERELKIKGKIYYYWDRFTHKEDLDEVIKRYKIVEGKKNNWYIRKNFDESMDLYFTRVIGVWG